VLETKVPEGAEKASQGQGCIKFIVCGPHNVVGRKERERGRERERMRARYVPW
jgi:hypothetical protein